MNVLDLVRNRGIEVKRAASTGGGEYWSSCPGCGGRDRFHVWPDQNGGTGSYWCRGCEKHGDNIQFLMDFDGKTYPEACLALDIQAKGQDYRTPKPMSSWMDEKKRVRGSGFRVQGKEKERKKTDLPADLWLEKAGKFVSWAHEKLIEDKKQIGWLKKRGINRTSIEKYKLGWNPGDNGKDIFRPRESWGLPIEKKPDGRKKALWLPIGLVIPKLKGSRIQGAEDSRVVVRIRIRRPEGEPRYYVIPGSDMDLMVSEENCRAYSVLESELDMILVAQEAGDLAGTVGLGTAGAKPDEKLMETLRKSAVILLAHDYDKAGAKAKTWWEAQFPQAKRWPVPAGGDPGEAYEAGIDIRAWIRAGLPDVWFIGQSLLDSKMKRGQVIEDGGPMDEGGGMTDAKDHPSSIGFPAGILELAKLLRTHPVMILNTPERLKVCEGVKWSAQNWEASKRISHLVYRDPEVFGWLSEHPEEKINGENILKEAGNAG